MVEGRVSQFKWLRRVAPVNFAIAQLVLIGYLEWLIRSRRISVIRAGDPYYNGLLALLLARLNRLPLVVRVNSNQDAIYQATGDLALPRLLRSRKVEQAVARFVLERAGLVAAGSQNNLQFALANGARPDRATIFRYGTWVDPIHFLIDPADRSPVASELGLGDRPFLVLVSRLEPVKHPDDVLRVLAEAKSSHPELAAVLIGDGTLRRQLERSAIELGIADDVRFVGNRDQQWIARALSSATIVLSPLTGRALVEASLSGTPVVAYDVEWHSELIRSGETGLLVPYRDISAMARAVCGLLDDPIQAAQLGQKARAATLEMMDPARLMEHERSEYRKLLFRPAPRPALAPLGSHSRDR
jgi:glycosyltransferase involved in cell wall biosynthesis